VRFLFSSFPLSLLTHPLRSFRTQVDASVLSHHRLKLFPAPSQAERVAQRLVPAPSPFKTRSLLSLERSARRRDLEDGQKFITESPTMKRLMSVSSLVGGKSKAKTKTSPDEPSDVFKVPGMPLKRKESLDKAEEGKAKASRKQERPRPLPRGGSTTGTKDVLKRREVSLTKKTSSAGLLKKTAPAKEDSTGEGEGRKRKRKSVSPKSACSSSFTSFPPFLLTSRPPLPPSLSCPTRPRNRPLPLLPRNPMAANPFPAPPPFPLSPLSEPPSARAHPTLPPCLSPSAPLPPPLPNRTITAAPFHRVEET
jgi:hypothetical protein